MASRCRMEHSALDVSGHAHPEAAHGRPGSVRVVRAVAGGPSAASAERDHLQVPRVRASMPCAAPGRHDCIDVQESFVRCHLEDHDSAIGPVTAGTSALHPSAGPATTSATAWPRCGATPTAALRPRGAWTSRNATHIDVDRVLA